MAVAGGAADAHDAGVGGCFGRPAVQPMLMMLASERCFWQWPAAQSVRAFGSGQRCSGCS